MLLLWKVVKVVWNLVFFAGDVWTISRWFQWDGLTVELSLGTPEYAALLAFFTGGLIVTNWTWIQRRRPSIKFGEYYPMIVNGRNHVLRYVGGNSFLGPDLPWLFSQMTEISSTLEGLSIRCPSTNPDNQKQYALDWFNFLTQLAPLARHRDLRKARKFSELFEHQGAKAALDIVPPLPREMM